LQAFFFSSLDLIHFVVFISSIGGPTAFMTIIDEICLDIRAILFGDTQEKGFIRPLDV